MSKAASRLARASCVAALALAVLAHAETRALYRWTDAQGRVQYSNIPPTGFKGEVTRIEVDTDANTTAPVAPRVPPDVMRDVVPQPQDAAKARRDKRAKLEAAVREARAKVAAAQAALDSGGDPKDGEQQVIRRQYAHAQSGKANCRNVVNDAGKNTVICPALVPNDEYYERQRGLEEALRKAEEDLSAAQEAYRRGVD